MKKAMLWLLLMMLSASLTACQSAPKAASTADKPLKELVESTIDTSALTAMPKADLEDVIGIDPEDMKEAVYLQDDGMGGREALVIRASGREAASRVARQLETYLEQRRKETRNYLPEAYKLLENAKVETRNLTVALISGENASEQTARLLAGE